MEQVRVLVTDGFEKEGVGILKSAGFEVNEAGTLTPEKLAELIPDYDVLIVRSATKVPAAVIQKAGRLKIVGRAGVGLDNIDVKCATACGIIVMNAPEGNTVSAAEHTLALLLALARNVPQAHVSVKNKQWERKKFMGTEIYGKTLGVIGLGRIGRRVAVMAKTLGMKVLGYDPYVMKDDVKDFDVSMVSLEVLCKQSDFISVHTPLDENTHHLLGEKEFELMKEGVRLINCARGGVIDEAVLARYVETKKVKGAALDVFEQEPPLDSPLLKLEEVVLTPHLGASTKEAQVNVAKDLAGQVVAAFAKKIIKNAVNLPALDEESLEKLRGYLSLGEKLGMLLRQLVPGRLAEITVEYSGEITGYDLSLLRSHVLKGILYQEPKVNIVNAHLVAKEQGIDIRERRHGRAGQYSNLITVEVKGQSTVQAGGTLTQNQEERIVQIDGFSVEAVPKGFLLITHNEDEPGIIGHIGTVLGRRGINIASMTLGRKKKGGPAITVLNLDAGLDETALKEIKELPVIHAVSLVRL